MAKRPAQMALGMEFEKGIKPAKNSKNTTKTQNAKKSNMAAKDAPKKAFDRFMEQVEEYSNASLKKAGVVASGEAGSSGSLANSGRTGGNNNAGGSSQQRELNKKAEDGRKQARHYQSIKARVFEIEQTNNSKVLVFSSGPGWYKIGGTSALIYAHMLAPRIGIKPSLKDDKDFYSKFEEGIISIRHLDLLKDNLEKIGVKLESETPEIITFALEKPLTKAELKTIQSVQEERERRVNQIVKTGKLYPSIAALLRKINKQMYSKYIHCSGNARTYVVETLAKNTLKSAVDVVMIANGAIDPKQGLTDIYDKNERLKVYLMTLMELGIFDADETLRIENDLVDANTQILAELKKLGKTKK